MDQPTFADLEYDSKKRKTRREIFLERMDSLIPFETLQNLQPPFFRFVLIVSHRVSRVGACLREAVPVTHVG